MGGTTTVENSVQFLQYYDGWVYFQFCKNLPGNSNNITPFKLNKGFSIFPPEPIEFASIPRNIIKLHPKNHGVISQSSFLPVNRNFQ